ncbi:MIF4G like-domain-containing protein [Hysterangium stoloniferum]|nr:MIF4G like-domain-containing protein [Hysterangium stoloniferum]
MPPERNNKRRYIREEYREPVETPEQILRNSIIRLGDLTNFDTQDLQRAARVLAQRNDATSIIAEGFRIGVTEQPYKIPFYSTLLLLLHQPTHVEAPDEDSNISNGSQPIGKAVLEDFWKGFQGFLDKQAWRELRLCIHFFAHLTASEVISTSSMLSLLQSFSTVLDEPGVSYSRALKAGLCVGEGLMRVGGVLHGQSPQAVAEMISSISIFADSVNSTKALVRPLMHIHAMDESNVGRYNELLKSLLVALQQSLALNFSEAATVFPQPFADLANINISGSSPFILPSILVPPEVIEIDSLDLGGIVYEEVKTPSKKDELPQYYLSLFDNEITPDIATPTGYCLRSAICDVVDIFEVNRKECARLLLEMPRWFTAGTFKPKPGIILPEREQIKYEKAWQLESTIIEAILSLMLVVPESQHKPVYYFALITELCKLSPQTVGPAVGKSIRKIYNFLGDGLDVEIAQRFSEWFAVHMSNFNFQWVWKEWVPDLSLPTCHPKRTFINRAVQFEIRLSYHDRVMKTLPEAMHSSDAGVMSAQPPGPEYDYDDSSHAHHEVAQSLLSLLRGRSNVNEVMNHVETLKNNLTESGESEHRASSLMRSIVVQSLLHIGSRSFSHFLNAMERYLSLLRSISTPDGKADVLEAAGDFWRRNPQMIIIVFDKLMQYQIVDPSNVVAWSFTLRSSKGNAAGITTAEWQLIQGALDKSIGRVAISKRRLAALRKEDDDARARIKARTDGGANMDVDSEVKDETTVELSPALATAVKGYSTLTQDQKNTLARVLTEFVIALRPSSFLIADSAWDKRSHWGQAEWSAWETWGWYRHFLRAYSPHLRNYYTSFEADCFEGLETNEATTLLKKLWVTAVGQD